MTGFLLATLLLAPLASPDTQVPDFGLPKPMLSVTDDGLVAHTAGFQGRARVTSRGIRLSREGGKPFDFHFAGSASRQAQRLGEPAFFTSFSRKGNREWRLSDRVRFRSVYQGVNLEVYASGRNLEYDFIVEPNQNPDQIQVTLPTGSKAHLTRAGELKLTAGADVLIKSKPVASQVVNGRQVPVACSYRLNGTRLMFDVGDYDRSKALVIDPVIAWGNYYGSSGDESASPLVEVAPDGSYLLKTNQGQVHRFSSTGVYLRGIGITGASILGISFATDGSILLAGSTSSVDFPVLNAYDASRNGKADAFLTKLNPTGTTILSSTLFGGSQDDRFTHIKFAPDGTVVAVGDTVSNNLPVTTNAIRSTNVGYNRLLSIVRFKANLRELDWSTYFGTDGAYSRLPSDGGGVAVDSQNEITIASSITTSMTHIYRAWPTTPGAFQSQPVSLVDAYIFRLSADGSTVRMGTYLAGTGDDYVYGFALDSQGSPVIGGFTSSGDLPVTPTAFKTTAQVALNRGDGFLARISRDGTQLQASTYIGGSENGDLPVDSVRGVALDAQDRPYFVALSWNPAYPTTSNAFFPPASSAVTSTSSVSYLGRLSHDGSQLEFSSPYWSPPTGTVFFAAGLRGTPSGEFLMTGYARGAGLPFSVRDYTPGTTGNPPVPTADIYMAKISPLEPMIVAPGAFNGTSGLSATVHALVTDGITGTRLPNVNVDWTIAGVPIGSSVTNSMGRAYLTFTVPMTIPFGISPLLATAQSTASHFGGRGSGTFNNLGAPTTVWAGNRTGSIGANIGFAANLKASGVGIPGAKLWFSVDGVPLGSATTAADGSVSPTFAIPESVTSGAKTLVVEYRAELPGYRPSTTNASLTLSKGATKMWIGARTANIGSTVSLAARLQRVSDGLGLVNRTIEFSIDGVPVGTAVTDATGNVTLPYVVAEGSGAGVRTITASFAGDSPYAPISGNASLTANRANPTIWVGNRNGLPGANVTLASTLKAGSLWLQGRTLDFYLDGVWIGTGTTDAAGYATLIYVIPIGTPPGTKSIAVQFAGDGVANSGTGSATLTIN